MLGMLLFPVDQPRFFDAVVTTDHDRVVEIQVKRNDASSNWIWGALKMPASVFHELHSLWCEREKCDEFLGTLINAWLERGGQAVGIRAGSTYVDVGTLHGYREAVRMLSDLGDDGVQEVFKPEPDNTCLR
jgi:dTDP-glucose pyrophosphorylase